MADKESKQCCRCGDTVPCHLPMVWDGKDWQCLDCWDRNILCSECPHWNDEVSSSICKGIKPAVELRAGRYSVRWKETKSYHICQENRTRKSVLEFNLWKSERNE